MTIPDALTERIEAIAKREGRTPEEVIQTLLDEYEQQHTDTAERDPIEDFIGMIDADVTDMSVTVSQTLREIFGAKDGDTA